MARRRFDDDEMHWYALDVVRQKEYVAGYLLNKMGCVTFIPTETHFRKKNRYTKGKMEAARPTLPGMVFCGFPGPPDWYRVMGMRLVNGVLSLPDEFGNYAPRRIDTGCREWMLYRGRQLDGQLTLERHLTVHKGKEVERTAAFVSVQGKGVIRSNGDMKAKAGADRPLVIRAAGERAKLLGAMLRAPDEQKRKAA